ncbi:hypothetical protein N7533_012498 [Penicillium manginii]|uniref:uncharacterized protein n=1 Tax=Penicillium manginii TaxID=203109 RepID=UPI0025472C40|nr:uncharacterized protein N7533_012498 [Penicillium manginii]KAJ5739714.1 hypothetical protein N7533_012498 [Penicillium manginii]
MAFIQCPRTSFSPLFRLLDDYEAHRSEPRPTAATPSFTPSFDVREASEGYYLDGELPGVDQTAIEIEFSDPQTLTVKGHTERNYQPQPHQAEHETEHTSSPRQHQATVEDEDEADSDSTSNSDDKRTSQKQKLHAEPAKQQKTQTEPDFHFWASERSIGEFQRTFTFPTRVDQDGVRASLKNGILSVYVPKNAAPKTKKIRIL